MPPKKPSKKADATPPPGMSNEEISKWYIAHVAGMGGLGNSDNNNTYMGGASAAGAGAAAGSSVWNVGIVPEYHGIGLGFNANGSAAAYTPRGRGNTTISQAVRAAAPRAQPNKRGFSMERPIINPAAAAAVAALTGQPLPVVAEVMNTNSDENNAALTAAAGAAAGAGGGAAPRAYKNTQVNAGNRMMYLLGKDNHMPQLDALYQYTERDKAIMTPAQKRKMHDHALLLASGTYYDPIHGEKYGVFKPSKQVTAYLIKMAKLLE